VRRRRSLIIACLATGAIVLPLGWFWWSSLLPGEYSVMDMGYVEYGGGSTDHVHDEHNTISVADLGVSSQREADVEVDLVARQEGFTLASGRTIDGFTLNGESPGPLIEATQGELVEVRVLNESVEDGMSLHWHGIDVPNSMDGVAGVTQDAVMVGEEFTYRFVADQVGTYWYHSHQVSHEQVIGGLFGTVIVHPAENLRDEQRVVEVPAAVHIYDGRRTVNGEEGDVSVAASPGDAARVRVINTDNGPMPVWVSGAEYRVVAVDGYDINEPTRIEGDGVLVTAGGRADLEVVVPPGGARVELGGNTALLLGADAGTIAPTPAPQESVDFLTYGSPTDLDFNPDDADRDFEYTIGRRPGFLDGKPGLWWTVNGHMYPDLPMFAVSEGDIVQMTITNSSGEVHPMHLHGHHAIVVARDGQPATGSPWWVDSLNVRDGESYDIAFVADNPGIWMDHCHNLPHAAEGLVAHLMYSGYSTPYLVGGEVNNEPE